MDFLRGSARAAICGRGGDGDGGGGGDGDGGGDGGNWHAKISTSRAPNAGGNFARLARRSPSSSYSAAIRSLSFSRRLAACYRAHSSAFDRLQLAELFSKISGSCAREVEVFSFPALPTLVAYNRGHLYLSFSPIVARLCGRLLDRTRKLRQISAIRRAHNLHAAALARAAAAGDLRRFCARLKSACKKLLAAARKLSPWPPHNSRAASCVASAALSRAYRALARALTAKNGTHYDKFGARNLAARSESSIRSRVFVASRIVIS